jgi:gluconolactonase
MVTRRELIKTLATSILGAHLIGCRVPQGIARRYEALQPGRFLSDLQIETRLEGATVFTEGPAVDRDGIVYFTDIPASRIHTWDPRAKKLSVFRENSNKANGLLFDPQGRLLVCEGSTGRLTRIDRQTGEVEILADAHDGNPLEPINDLARDARGRIYFTSRPSGEVPERRGVYVNAVYRVDPDGTVDQLLRPPAIDMPNGIVLSPDESKLYLVEAHSETGRARHIKSFKIEADGTLSDSRILIDFYPGRSGDGMCIDAEGNLYIAAGLHALRGTSETLATRPGIHVVSPEGALLDYLETPEDTVTNCTFGGEDLRTLYMTAGSLLLSARSSVPGHPRYRPEQ